MCSDIKDLGWANAWDSDRVPTPELVTKCYEARKGGETHNMVVTNVGHCVMRYTCRTCGYTYLADSSD